MKIYVGHSKELNYIEDLYKPIRELEKNDSNVFILPHEKDVNSNNSRGFYADLDLFIAEVSIPATGLGIELGWAYDDNVPIYCIYKKGSTLSRSLKKITNNFFEYETIEELKNILKVIIKQNEN